MRRFILISALLLASAAAQAGQPRGLILASNDEPKSERIEAVKPDEVKPEASAPVAPAPAVSTPGASAPVAPAPAVSTPGASTPAASAPIAPAPVAPKSVASKSVASPPAKKIHATSHESDEAKARRIAARYGISW